MAARRWGVGVVAAILVAACSFPDVEYDDAGTAATTSSGGASSASSGSGGGGSCPAPPPCASAATACAKDANTKQSGCVHPCKQDAACLAGCAAMLKTDLGACAATCESCLVGPCAMNNCKALVGL
jgi:hypothetical protein